jgi:hypothetical protein
MLGRLYMSQGSSYSERQWPYYAPTRTDEPYMLHRAKLLYIGWLRYNGLNIAGLIKPYILQCNLSSHIASHPALRGSRR